MTTTRANGYEGALDELAAALRDGGEMACVLRHFQGQLQGDRPDLDGPPVEAFPTPYQLRQALRRIDQALLMAEREWERLPAETRESAEPPGAMVGGGWQG